MLCFSCEVTQKKEKFQVEVGREMFWAWLHQLSSDQCPLVFIGAVALIN